MKTSELKELIQIFNEAGLSKLAIKNQAEEITLEKQITIAKQLPPAAESTKAVQPASKAVSENQLVVKAPFIGTFYAAPQPQAQPFVQVGDQVKKGQQLGIIEAMKMMNEIKAPAAGRIVELQAANGTAVEYDQPLFLIQK
ncbi:acetyl-CoA carboxylase biotin carboxyl carrier protein [Liquorilactobacillus nagelii]|uniref:acetyl-CoA carboxylase biotin carboxyl carrier protein n=1 Tax=Liquorilactobacillus nagelii TaxID=82688 RepID=UPI0006EFA0F7|nr:acetyl-CoA carboxylase biotin carboxyl carrier protein [Liquorilactobacillus nagelii]KRL41313.1 hypothetical protein FD45_GL000827 [Liquorilactobacillus nagelii DSM 13675]QYH54344.1 acetyl-CoA carboxylase biotin carboxyl carrier protein [Liquorilactobacillus nagelii DSM 13675]